MRCYINEQCYTNVGQNIRINTASSFFSFFILILKNNFHINNWIDKMDLHKEELKNSTVQPQNKAWSNRNSIHIKSGIRHAWADQSFGYKCSSYKNSPKGVGHLVNILICNRKLSQIHYHLSFIKPQI